ncbi:MAG: sugar phosphate isomerase/epimerase [Desulfurococcales archaeon]|nr:sugar phosphate isomerase/epimerase [Desulfurococcales archaeon]
MIVLNAVLPERVAAEEYVKEARKAGFDGFEVSIDYPHYYEPSTIVKALQIIKCAGLSVAYHLPWRDLSLASPAENVRKASVKEILKAIDTIGRLEEHPLYLVLHLETSQSNCGFRSSKCVEAAVKSLNEIMPVTSDMGFEVLVETTEGKCCGGESELPYILREVPDVHVCLDVTHLTLSRWRRVGVSQKPPEIIEDQAPILLERVRAVHIHGIIKDSVRGMQPHGMIGTALLRDICNTLIRLNVMNKLEAITFEIFRDVKTVHQLSRLRKLVKQVKESARKGEG